MATETRFGGSLAVVVTAVVTALIVSVVQVGLVAPLVRDSTSTNNLRSPNDPALIAAALAAALGELHAARDERVPAALEALHAAREELVRAKGALGDLLAARDELVRAKDALGELHAARDELAPAKDALQVGAGFDHAYFQRANKTGVPVRSIAVGFNQVLPLHERSSVSDGSLSSLKSEIEAYFTAMTEAKIVLTDQIILDVGANIGTFSLQLSVKCPKCKIVALEPAMATFLMLQLNVAHLPNVIALNYGLGIESGIRSFLDNPSHSQGSSMVPNAPTTGVHSFIRVISMNDLTYLLGIKDADINILKIDCEGCEYEIYEEPFWRTKRSIVLGETHERWGYKVTDKIRNLEKELRALPWVRLN